MTAESRPEGFTDPQPMEYSDINQKKAQAKCCSLNLKIFIGVLAFSFFSKSLTGSYTKSTITQIERRFEIPSSTVGIIDGSFEMGNLLVITVVSYFGAKFHRPKIIGAGALLMAAGTLLMALPHFLMGRYKYETIAARTNDANNFTWRSPCSPNTLNVFQQPIPGCQKGEEEGSPMWVILLAGNIIRGIGEATIAPLGISFIDDYARPENSAFYIGCLHTVGVIGPLFGYSLGSLCASLYVDIGLVNQESVTITPQDSRWVGAWWLGFVVAGGLTLLAALPFWFLPRALPENPQIPETDPPSNQHQHTGLTEIAKDFWPSLKCLFTNKIYFLYLISNVVMFNAFVIVITYTPKYLEQQFGQSTSKTNFLIGVTTMPSVALGIFLSGVIMKRFKLGLLGAARVAFFTSVTGLLCTLPNFGLSCENLDVAGVTVPFQGSNKVRNIGSSLLSSCNAECKCPDTQWDPVCGQNGVTYISPCYAGCNSTLGNGLNMTFHGCTCIQSSGLSEGNSSAVLGQCSRERSCSRMFYIFLALQSISFFVYCLGSTPLFIISLRCVEPKLKSLSVGMLLLVLRVLGGIPAPIYFGALIDSTCLKWGSKKCGGRGACRMYDIQTLRFLFLGLIGCLRVLGYALFWIAVIQIKKKIQMDKRVSKNIELQKPVLCDAKPQKALNECSAEENDEVQKPLKEVL
ncbi:solute carrier organic anion transporter family member 1C1-like [Myxocyprinus asiaticus]|uniref:solute carrier organic anion transporter family member 1C1-like n=1 Tax=Myxocyprinus asiaticus TaxID=70543 RepID=UPI002221A2BF|nr:solute carrier organic anion transporter family member 1C1-like [Myxocyprinus asiaticus]